MRAKSQEKVDKVKNLCQELQVSLSAKQHLDQNGMIESIVVFTDNENYPKIERAPKEGEQTTVIEENKQDAEPSSI